MSGDDEGIIRGDAASVSDTGPVVDSIVVIIPAHDEQDRIVETLRSVERSAAAQPLPVVVVVVLDTCTDGTEQAVEDFVSRRSASKWIIISSSAQRASTARQIGLDRYVAGLDHRALRAAVAVLSTDADTAVPEEWIRLHTSLLDDGFDAVAGIVDLAPGGTDDDLDHQQWQHEYTTSFDDDGSHAHVHCANVSIRLEALMAAGGFGHAERAEDIDMWQRLRAVSGARLRSDQRSVVTTSSRRDGRVVGGFATALDQFRTDSQ